MATNWQVTNQVQREELLSSGKFEDGWEVYYETLPEGIPGKIWVSVRNYNADNVRNLIDAAVTKLKEVQNL